MAAMAASSISKYNNGINNGNNGVIIMKEIIK
jgi:hypothetical protein